MKISISAVDSPCFSSLRRIANSLHYVFRKQDLFKQLPETAQITCFMMTSMSMAYSASFNSVRNKSNYVANESLQISIGQKLLGTDQTSCFIMIFMSVRHSHSLNSPRRLRNSRHYESFKNKIYLIAPENSSNHFFHHDSGVCGIFCKLQPFTTRTEFYP